MGDGRLLAGQLLRVGGGGARHRVGLRQLRGQQLGRVGPGFLARLEPVERACLDVVAQVGPAADEDDGAHGHQAQQGQGVVADFQETLAHVAEEDPRRICGGGPDPVDLRNRTA